MGKIIIKIPYEIDQEYELNNLEAVEKLLETIKHAQKKRASSTKVDSVLGLFADEPDLIDEVTEMALQSREIHPLRPKE